MKQTILVAGATGMLGSRIAHHLLEREDAIVRLLLRPGLEGKKRATADELVTRGAEVIEGDLADHASLDRATRGVDVIVSAVQGGTDAIVDGQVALAETGKRNGVRRILPSDFGLDLFKATPGEHPAFNARATADKVIEGLGIEHIHMLQGAFMGMLQPGSPLIDYDKGTVTFWGDGKQPIELTTVEDTARMTARVALDRDVPSGKFAFAGDRLSFQQVADIAQTQTGKTFKRHSLGNEQQLRSAMKEMAASDPGRAIMLAYQLYMLNGQTSLDDLQSDRYPDLRLQNYTSFLAEQLGD
ncbi:NAD-dependent epimerase/dehydratase family protein [Verticiella sediminum]|uniref:NAD-dependent epimerase/dehydratase family protein n=1 Tax=Verticiella sediminum TaxID=1247510 RepID=A0A556AX88_9BURK|nr:NmrA family NAD(P)-binding protein [Verticiella sediminum]TSH97563.1 NAD-dependent epimerase/dehydratase family protein [Verticiella sediminum]